MRSLVHSLFRIVVGVVIGLALMALGLRLFINPPGLPSRGTETFVVLPSDLERHVRFLCEQASPRNYRHTEQLERAADYVAERLSEAGGAVERQRFEVNGTSYQNVRAVFGPRGKDIVVLGAHYDVFGDLPGADDNASGIAVLLEVAKLLNRTHLGCTVEVVALSLEEPPYLGGPDMGSVIHARLLRRTGLKVRGAVILEMVGYYTEKQAWSNTWPRLVYPDHGKFVVVVGRSTDRRLARSVKGAANAVSGVPFHAYVGPVLGVSDLSDHRSYWAEGITAVMITDTGFVRNPNYHTERDTPETLDYRRMAEVARGTLSAVVELASP